MSEERHGWEGVGGYQVPEAVRDYDRLMDDELAAEREWDQGDPVLAREDLRVSRARVNQERRAA